MIRVLGSQLVTIVTDFSTTPDLPSLAKTTFMIASSPGKIGFLGYSGIVQPQLPLAEEIIKFDPPIFFNLKPKATFSPVLYGQNHEFLPQI